jgi:hypothetical protein
MIGWSVFDKAGIWGKVLGVGAPSKGPRGLRERKEEERPSRFGIFAPVGVKTGSLTIESKAGARRGASGLGPKFGTGMVLSETVIAARCPYLCGAGGVIVRNKRVETRQQLA